MIESNSATNRQEGLWFQLQKNTTPIDMDGCKAMGIIGEQGAISLQDGRIIAHYLTMSTRTHKHVVCDALSK